MEGETLFHWHNKRCGYSEQIHDTMKSELAGRVEKMSRSVFIYLHGIEFFEKLRGKIGDLKWVPT
jgi:hypothetical protein